ncbi:MAG: xanthine dehydrogenase family protein molybdopterin-binding subunit [Chloroflexi bacterium]|nr:xanthine dehydrogenase family protein molybdopterin-binding subunit [Chloroflexota bacterium]
MTELKVVGKPFPRVDAQEKVTGEAIFGTDVKLPGMLVGKFLGSPHPHAEIVSIDTSEAEKLPGVHAVITAADLPQSDQYDPGSRAHAVLARDRVLFVGQPVAAVAAEDLSTAEEALARIRVEYRPLPAVLDPVEAMQPGSPVIQHGKAGTSVEMDIHTQQAAGVQTDEPGEGGNVVNHILFEQGDIEQAFAESDVIVERQVRMPMVHQGYIEPHAQTAAWDSKGNLTMWLSTQGQFVTQETLCEVLGLEASQVRVISTEIGGGFGGKASLFAPLTAVLARKAGRPVRLVLTRSEELQAANPAPMVVIDIKVGARKDGRITGIRAKVVMDTGAYPGAPMTVTTLMLGQPYKFTAMYIDGYEVLTNKPSVTAYRAPGGPNASAALEPCIDMLARELGMDPLAFRKLNAAEEGDLQPHGRPHPRIGLKEVLEAIEPAWRALADKPKKTNGRLRGRGVACGGWGGGRGPGSALVLLDPDGTFRLVTGTVDLTGSFTSLAQIAAEGLGVSLSQVRPYKGDTATGPWAPMSAGSQTTYGQGPAVLEAALDARRQVLEYAARELDADPDDLTLTDGRVYVTDDPSQEISLSRLYLLTHGWDARYEPVVGRGAAPRRSEAPGYAASVAEVEVDPETGKVVVTYLATAQDVGQAINPLSVEGQIQGGTAQSIGMGLWEELVFDERGRLLNPNLLDYRQATAADLPMIDAILVNVPAGDGAFGLKIVGEPSIVPPIGAIANAIADAIGVYITDYPITAERVWRAMQDA